MEPSGKNMTLRPTIFALWLFMTIIAMPLYANATAVAAGDNYTVQNVAVDVQGENAIDARDKALTKARRDAFDIIAGRLLNAEEKSRLGAVDDSTINSMVYDFEINREKFSKNRYLASVNVRFNERAVQSYFMPYMPQDNYNYGYDGSGYGQNQGYNTQTYDYDYGQTQTPTVTSAPSASDVGLILPWFKQNQQTTLWQDTNPWMEAWKQWTQTEQAKEMRLLTPIGDLTDMQLFNPEQPLNYDQTALIRLLERYGAGYAIIAMADPLPNGMLNVTLYQSTTANPRFIDKIVAPAGTMNGAAAYFPAIWQSAKKAKETPASYTASYGDTGTVGQPANIPPFARDNTVLVPFEAEIALANIQQWVGIKQSLSQMPGMQDMQVKSLSAGKAVVGFRYAGDVESLNAALTRKGMNIYKNPVLTPGKVPYIIAAGRS